MKKTIIICVVISILQLIAAVILYGYLPEQVPHHWNGAGEIDGYAGKWIIFLFPAISVGVTAFLTLLPKIDPKGENILKSAVMLEVTMLFVVILMAAVIPVIACAAFGIDIHAAKIIPSVVGIFLAVSGNFMPKIKQNYFVGIRTPWTLANEIVWQKTHRVGGWVFLISGITLAVGVIMPVPFNVIVPVCMIIGGTVWAYLYSFLLFKRTK